MSRGFKVLNDLSPTRFGGLNHLTATTPDVTIASGDVSEKRMTWWTEDLGRSSSDHLCIYTRIALEGELAERPRRKWVIRSGSKLDWVKYAAKTKIMADTWLDAYANMCDEVRDIKANRMSATDATTPTEVIEEAVGKLMAGIVDTARETHGVRRQGASKGTQPWMTEEIQSKLDEFRALAFDHPVDEWAAIADVAPDELRELGDRLARVQPDAHAHLATLQPPL